MRRPIETAVALSIIAITGCGQAVRTAVPSASPTPSPSIASPSVASASATPLFDFPVASGTKCPDLAALGVRRALLKAIGPSRLSVVLCDASDQSHPRLLKAMEGSSNQAFLREDLLGYITHKGDPSWPPEKYTSAVSTLDLSNGQSKELTSSPGVAQGGTWSADLSTVAYFVLGRSEINFWIKRGAQTQVPLRPPIPVLGRGGVPDDEALARFSPDGQYLVLVETAVNLLEVFRTSDGIALYTAPSGGTMAVWAHQADRLYFRDDSGVNVWDPAGGVATFLPGLRWFDPSLSGDDRFVAYSVGMRSTPHVEVRELSSGSTVSSSPSRALPTLLSSTTVLVENWVACDTCLESPRFTGETLSFHTDSRAERDLGIAGWTLGPFWPPA